MKFPRYWLNAGAATLLVVGALTQFVYSQGIMPNSDETTGVSKPSETVRLAFGQPGIIKDMVKPGTVVKAGDVIGSLDDFLQRKEYESAKIDADSNAQVEAAQADLDLKRKVLERKRHIYAQEGMNNSEVEEAELDVLVDEKRLQVAKDKQLSAQIKAEQEGKKLELNKLVSTVNGVIQEVNVHAGEATDMTKQEGAAIIVQNDPVYIEAPRLKTRQVAKLKIGDKMMVRYENDPADAWQEATIWYISPVASSVDTQMVKLTMPNPTLRTAGLGVFIKLPPEVAQAGRPDAALASKNP